MSVNEKMTAIADAIREKTGRTEPLTLDQMAQEIAGIQVGGGDDIYKQMVSGVPLEKFEVIELETLRSFAFYSDNNIKEVYLPNCSKIGVQVFRLCSGLKKVLFVAPPSNACFVDCTALEALILPSETFLTLVHNNTFARSSVENGTGFIYVPSALLETYKSATNWSVYADQFRAIEGSEYE